MILKNLPQKIKHIKNITLRQITVMCVFVAVLATLQPGAKSFTVPFYLARNQINNN